MAECKNCKQSGGIYLGQCQCGFPVCSLCGTLPGPRHTKGWCPLPGQPEKTQGQVWDPAIFNDMEVVEFGEGEPE